MRALFFIVALACLPSPLRALEPIVPQLGDRVPEKAIQLQAQILTSSSQTRHYRLFDSGAVNWDLGASDEGRLTYVSTKDSRFHTPEGILRGHAILRCAEAPPEKGCRSPWLCVVLLPSGWKIAFVRGKGLTDKPLLNSTPVSFIYRSSDGA